MANAKFLVIGNVNHDGELKKAGDVIELDHESETAIVLVKRGYIKLAKSKEDAPAPNNGMEPAAVKENDPGSAKVETNENKAGA